MNLSTTENLTTQAFVYEKIDEPRQIRLMRAYEDHQIPDQIRFELLNVSLDHLKHHYTAISYCWREPANLGTVWGRDNRHFRIPNSAMSVLRNIIIKSPKRHFWIDALCINQNDNEEKERQVKLMREIYASAKRVIVWMGEASFDSDTALEFVPVLSSAITELRRKVYATGQPLDDSMLNELPLCNFPSPRWVALIHFLERPWFRRVWVIQEVAASSSVTIMCGRKTIEWHTFAGLMYSIHHNNLSRPLMIDLDRNFKAPPKGFENTITILEFQNANRWTGGSDIQHALGGTRLFKATDARDLLFAIRGIASNAADEELSPNYNDSPTKVYTAWAAHLLTRKNTALVILHLAGIGYDRCISDLPSWVPDWTSEFQTVLGANPEEFGYKAGNSNEKALITYNPIYNTIMLRGHIIDTVDRFIGARFITEAETSNPNARKKLGSMILGRLIRASNLLSPDGLYHNGEPVYPDAVGRTLTANLNNRLRPANKHHPGYFSSYLSVTWLEASGCFTEPAQPERNRQAHLFVEAYSIFGAGRSIFATKNDYLGLGPPGIRKHDRVCILVGFCTPFIIRKKSEGGFALIGECYVHGLMNSEGLGIKEAENIELA